MRLLIAVLLATGLLSPQIIIIAKKKATGSPFDVGFNFRANQSYEADDHSTACGNTTTATTCIVATTANYPASTTVNGYTFNAGWEQAPGGMRDRSAANDTRLAGVAFINQTIAADVDFRVTLPSAGTYTVHLAMGDATTATTSTVQILDDTTVKLTIGPHATTANQFYDAAATLLTNTTWPVSEVGVPITFATTVFRLRLVKPGAAANIMVAHLRIHNP